MIEPSTVFVVDDHAGVREGLTILTESVGLKTEAFASAEEFLAAYQQDRPGCLVLDVRMPGMGGLDLLEVLSAHDIHLPVIILTGHGDVPMATKAFKSGAMDFVQKPFQEEELLGCIRKAIFYDQESRRSRCQTMTTRSKIATLTPRERQVMELMVGGATTKSIAVALQLSPKTIDFHRVRLMDKLGIDSVAELVRMSLLSAS